MKTEPEKRAENPLAEVTALAADLENGCEDRREKAVQEALGRIVLERTATVEWNGALRITFRDDGSITAATRDPGGWTPVPMSIEEQAAARRAFSAMLEDESPGTKEIISGL